MCLGGVIASVQQTRRKMALLGMDFNQANQSTETKTGSRVETFNYICFLVGGKVR